MPHSPASRSARGSSSAHASTWVANEASSACTRLSKCARPELARRSSGCKGPDERETGEPQHPRVGVRVAEQLDDRTVREAERGVTTALVRCDDLPPDEVPGPVLGIRRRPRELERIAPKHTPRAQGRQRPSLPRERQDRVLELDLGDLQRTRAFDVLADRDGHGVCSTWVRSRMYSSRSGLVRPGGGWTGLLVNGLIGPPFALVNDARSGACPEGSMRRTCDPSGSVYWVPADDVGWLGKPAASRPACMRLWLTGTGGSLPAGPATKSGTRGDPAGSASG